MNRILRASLSLLRRINDRIRIAPAHIFESQGHSWLVLLDDVLLCPGTRQQRRLDGARPDLGDPAFLERLAGSAKEITAGDSRPVGLLLPLSEFVYSHYSIQLGEEFLESRDLVLSALMLQRDLLLPAMDREFALGAAPGRAEGVAFWLPEDTRVAIEAAFSAAGLRLAAILPRPLAVAPAQGPAHGYLVQDEDASTSSAVWIEGSVATRVLSADRREFENEDIRNAWNEQLLPLANGESIRLASRDDWFALPDIKGPYAEYAFFTRGFLDAVAGRNRQRKTWAAVAAAASAVLFLALPLIYQWADALRLESGRDELRLAAAAAEGFQGEILDMERDWGVVYEYPDVDIAGILSALNSVITNSLTSFSLDESSIEIQGSTSDPEHLTRLLVAMPMFENIQQSRSISGGNAGGGDRFGLRMNLTDHDFDAYAKKYEFE